MLEKLTYNLKDYNQLNYGLIPDSILLNRIEKKYILNHSELLNIINELRTNYLCLEVNDSIINKYNNIYFDTPDFDFYLLHHNNVANRLKIRKRYYKTTNTSYLEIKQKQNERTFKSRLQINNSEIHLAENELDFILKNTSLTNSFAIKSNVQINYKRLSLINKDFSERLSFDFDIEFISNTKKIELHDLVIAECKQIQSYKSHFVNAIKFQNIKQTSFSKYCIAISKLFPSIKHNNFKQQLTFLENYFYDNAINAVTN
ncbi:MAG: polyphosphate polymerase domain-containing protein [Bacteroidota bacterium]|nr:polyphosphate polymerase domain-containing protein [Bacteroidota bacterium]